MTSPNLIPPPPKFVLPLSEGGDLVVDFQNVDPTDNATFVDYADGVTVTLYIDSITPVVAVATVSGHDATVRVESTVTDVIPSYTTWRVIVETPGDPATEVVAANGTTIRFDGR